MKLLIKFPTRGRKDKFFSTLDKYYEYCKNIDNMDFLISLDEDDNEMNNTEVLKKLSNYKNIKVVVGLSKSKIDAVNRDLNNYNKHWDVVLLASDDMIPTIKGYDDIIRDNMMFNYPDTDGILFFNDGFQGNKLNTLCILGKKYYERFNYIYHPDYKSCWSDNEFMVVGNILKRQSYIDQVIIRHEHPDWGYGNIDYVHNNNVKDWHHDNDIYNKRLINNFYI
jgi:uncharacterized protein YerC